MDRNVSVLSNPSNSSKKSGNSGKNSGSPSGPHSLAFTRQNMKD